MTPSILGLQIVDTANKATKAPPMFGLGGETIRPTFRFN